MGIPNSRILAPPLLQMGSYKEVDYVDGFGLWIVGGRKEQ